MLSKHHRDSPPQVYRDSPPQVAIGILYSGIAHGRQPNFRHRKKPRNGGILRLHLAYGRRSNYSLQFSNVPKEYNVNVNAKFIMSLIDSAQVIRTVLRTLHHLHLFFNDSINQADSNSSSPALGACSTST